MVFDISGVQVERASIQYIDQTAGQEYAIEDFRLKTGRIAQDAEGWRIAVKEWFARFEVVGERIVVSAITSGVRPRNLDRAKPIHRELIARFGR